MLSPPKRKFLLTRKNENSEGSTPRAQSASRIRMSVSWPQTTEEAPPSCTPVTKVSTVRVMSANSAMRVSEARWRFAWLGVEAAEEGDELGGRGHCAAQWPIWPHLRRLVELALATGPDLDASCRTWKIFSRPLFLFLVVRRRNDPCLGLEEHEVAAADRPKPPQRSSRGRRESGQTSAVRCRALPTRHRPRRPSAPSRSWGSASKKSCSSSS